MKIISGKRTRVNPGQAIRLLITASFAIPFIVMGVIYITRDQFMPYHETAVGMQWQQLQAEIQILVLALMRATGGGLIAVGLVAIYLQWLFEMQRKVVYVIALLISVFLMQGGLLLATYSVSTQTPASPPFLPTIASVSALLIVAVWDFWLCRSTNT